MYTATLRKVGGSIMVAVPPAFLEMLNIDNGSTIKMEVNAGRIILEPEKLQKYTLQELLAQCDMYSPLTDEDIAWTDDAPKGRESI